MIDRHQAEAGDARDCAAGERPWTRPQVRRLATSGAETGAGAGFDADETPS